MNKRFYNKTIFGTSICLILSTILILINHAFDITYDYIFIIAGYSIGTLIADIVRNIRCKSDTDKDFKNSINDVIDITEPVISLSPAINSDIHGKILSIIKSDPGTAEALYELNLVREHLSALCNRELIMPVDSYTTFKNYDDKSGIKYIDETFKNSDEYSYDYIDKCVNNISQYMKNMTKDIIDKIENTDYGNDACGFLKLKKKNE